MSRTTTRLQRAPAHKAVAKGKYPLAKSKIAAFQKLVLAYYAKSGRHSLPWRKTRDPYKILVSEIMLQQTQVDRVVPKFTAFITEFGSPQILAGASLSKVLRMWQGLGYNRRAKMLHTAAKEVVSRFNGKVPEDREELMSLSGVGPYTASAVRVFAFDVPETVIETNIRTVYIHHFFPNRTNVLDTEIVPYIEATLPQKNYSEWYSALMDYGSYIKSHFPNPSRRSKHHTRQKPFKGSDREIRGAILKVLTVSPSSLSKLPFESERVKKQASTLVREGMIAKKGRQFTLSQ